MPVKLIADSGSTKCEWCLVNNNKTKTIITGGISPYFLNGQQIVALLQQELIPSLKNNLPEEIFYYGTGLKNPANATIIKKALKILFPQAFIEVQHDLLGAARALCGREKGVACILGTGCNSASYNGKKIMYNSPGLGYVLGDEGSGAYLGKKVLQYFLYNTFDEDMHHAFITKYNIDANEILDNVYKKPLPNRYLASFAMFLAENRGHYMIENIIEDGINDFFFTHLNKYKESFTSPVHFTGSVAYGFRDVLKTLCGVYGFTLGNVLQHPMKGLIKYHTQ